VQLVVETSSHRAICVQVSSAYLSPQRIGFLCSCCVVYWSQEDTVHVVPFIHTWHQLCSYYRL